MSRMAIGVAQAATATLPPPTEAASAPSSSPAPCETATILHPAPQLALDDVEKNADTALAVVEAGDKSEVLAAMFEKNLLVLTRDLLERLEAIGCKARCDDGQMLHAVARQRFDGLVGIGLQPFRTAEARLESEFEPRAERS